MTDLFNKKRMKECIICHCQFKSAPPEHVIPKSIGGQYTIHNVCGSCNLRMNRLIDEPFKKNPYVAVYRFVLETKGRGKKIDNPLKGRTVNMDGEEYGLYLTESLECKAKSKPEFPKIRELQYGSEYRISIDEEDIPKLNDYLDKAAIHLNIPRSELRINKVIKEYRPESTAQIPFDPSEIVLEHCKILYETACDLFGQLYSESESARKYAKMIHTGAIDASMKNLISPSISIVNEVSLQLHANASQLKDSHVVILFGYLGIGLLGFLKIFDHTQVLILSDDVKFENSPLHFVVNDFKNHKLNIARNTKIPNCLVKVNPNYVIEKERFDSEFATNPSDSEYPVFNERGELVYRSLFELVNDSKYYRRVSTNCIDELSINVFTNNSIFINSTTIKTKMPIESIDFICELEVVKNR